MGRVRRALTALDATVRPWVLYALVVNAVDAAGDNDPTDPFVRFTVT